MELLNNCIVAVVNFKCASVPVNSVRWGFCRRHPAPRHEKFTWAGGGWFKRGHYQK